MQNALAVVTVVVAGLMVGVEFAVAVFVNPMLNRLPDDSIIAARGAGGRVLGRVMPPWYIGSMVLGAVWAILAWGGAGASLVTAATALLAVSVVMSLLVLVPMNNEAMTWTAENRPADWKRRAGRWDRYHYVRVGVIVLAFALFAVALGQ